MYSLARVPKHQGPVSPSELTAKFRAVIDHPAIKITTQRSRLVLVDQVCVGGLYDPDHDQCGEPCVEVYLLYHPDQQHLVLTVAQWQRLCFEVAECIGHELVHRSQARRRKYKIARDYVSRDHCKIKREEQEYLGSRDEIEAYGFSIAAELAAMYGSFDIDSPCMNDIVMWQVYQSSFDTDQSVVLKLKRQISKYLRRLEADYNDQQNSKRSGAGRRVRHAGRSSR